MDEFQKEMLEKLSDIREVQVAMQKDLENHIRRTELAENRLDQLEQLASEVRQMLPQIRSVLRYWPVVSGVLISVVIGKPELLTQLLDLLK